jgi:hypothetical protein
MGRRTNHERVGPIFEIPDGLVIFEYIVELM